MTTGVVLYTRDLRVHDHPALMAAVDSCDRVVPLFVFDDAILGGAFAAPNRIAFLLDSLRDLRSALEDRGGELVVRRGNWLDEVAGVLEETAADHLHLSSDVSAFARDRERRLAEACEQRGVELTIHPGITAVPPGQVQPSGGEVFQVFTPYWRRWKDQPLRHLLPAPDRVATPTSIATGRMPSIGDLVSGGSDGGRSPDLVSGGETEARGRYDAWLEGPAGDYAEQHDALADDDTSRLSPYLHFGCLSPRELLDRLDRRNPGHDAFARQLCWRDFHHQVTWGHPTIGRDDIRPRGDDWRHDEDALTAWKEGRTGYPLVDAGMRQLLREGWMHNRARLVTASFLTKHLYIDWRVGAQHFFDWLVDGDLVNNAANWQWVAGTGTDSRPNRMFNPVAQSRRYDPDGTYLRRYVPELAGLSARDIHEPHKLDGQLDLGGGDGDVAAYPAPIVDHAEARERFLDARGSGQG